MEPLSFHQRFLIAATLFVVSGFAALILQQPLIILAPFAYLLIPPIFSTIVFRTEFIFYALIALLPLSTELNITPSLGLDFPDEVLMMLLTGIFILKWFYKPSFFPTSIYRHPLILLVALQLTWVLFCCYFSTDHWLSTKFLLAKSWYIVPFVIIPQIVITQKGHFKSLALLLLLPMAFAVLQTLIRHAFEGFTFEGIKNTLSPFFRNHVNYSAMLVCMLPIAWTVNKLTPKENKYKSILTVGLVIGVVGVVLSYSRGAWTALIIGVLAGVLICKRLIGWVLIVTAVVIAATSIWLTYNNHYLKFASDFNSTIFHKDLGQHLQATVQLKDVSNAERFYRWVAAGNMIADRPITGFGPNTFYSNYKSYTVTLFKTWVSNNPEHSTVHNYFLLLLIEQGIPGCLLFTILYALMIVESQRLYIKHSDPFYKTISLCIGIILAMIGTLNFMSDLIETDKIGSLFWLCLGMLILLKQKLHSTSNVQSIS